MCGLPWAARLAPLTVGRRKPRARALREAGASEEKALAAVADLLIPQHLASKEDLLEAIAGLEVQIANLRAEVKTEIVDLKASFYRQLWIMGAGIVTVNAAMVTAIVTLAKLFLFPQ